MIIIKAPSPTFDYTIILPNPILSNTEGVFDERNYKFAMDKTVYSTIKRNPGLRYDYTFSLVREKMYELFDFIKLFAGTTWRWTDHHGQVITGKCISNPHESTLTFPYKRECDDGYSINELATFNLELES